MERVRTMPEQEADDLKERLFCFLDASRPCDSECMAYLTARPEGMDYKGQPWSQCILLVNAHRGGKHLTVLASMGADIMKHLKIKAADATREANNPSAIPKGG